MRLEKRLFKIVAAIFTVVHAVAIFFLMMFTYASLKEGSEIVTTFRTDWQQTPFIDLILVDPLPNVVSEAQSTACPAGY